MSLLLTFIFCYLWGGILTLFGIGSVMRMGGGGTSGMGDILGKMGGGINLGLGNSLIAIGPNVAKSYVDSVTRYGAITAVNTGTVLTYSEGGVVGNQKVPSDAKFIARIDVSIAPDMDNTGGVYKILSGFSLSGSGVKKGGSYRFAGPCGAAVAVNNTGYMINLPKLSFACRIPVKPDELQITGYMLAEDAGEFTMSVTIYYSATDPDAGIVDCDTRHVNITAVDTPTSLTAWGADTLGNFQVPSDCNRAIAVATGMAVDFTAGAAVQRAIAQYRLTSSGLESGGSYSLQSGGMCYAAQGAATAGGQGASINIENINLGLKPGNIIDAKGTMIGEDSGDMTLIMSIMYS